MRETPRKQASYDNAVFPIEQTSRNATGDVYATRPRSQNVYRFSGRRTNGNSDSIPLNYRWMINGGAFTITQEYKTTIMRRSCLGELNEK